MNQFPFIIANIVIFGLLAYYCYLVIRATKTSGSTKAKVFLGIFLNYLPLFLSVLCYCILLSLRNSVVSNIDFVRLPYGSKEDINLVYNSYAFMAGNSILIAVASFFYILDIILHLSKNTNTKASLNGLAIILTAFTIAINSIFFYRICDLLFIQQNLSTGGDNLEMFEVLSTISMALFLIIDSVLYHSFSHASSAKKEPIDRFVKSIKFSIWNVDIASLLALAFLQYIDNYYLEYTGVYINYVFMSAGIAIQAVLTQFVFSSYQAKKTLETLHSG